MSFLSDLLGAIGNIFQGTQNNFGINILSGTGKLVYSTAAVTWNQVDFFYLPGGQTFSKFYETLVGKEVLVTQVFVNPPPLDRRAVAYTIVVNNGTVTLGGGSEAVFVLVLMR